jgi:hypothetical protein
MRVTMTVLGLIIAIGLFAFNHIELKQEGISSVKFDKADLISGDVSLVNVRGNK